MNQVHIFVIFFHVIHLYLHLKAFSSHCHPKGLTTVSTHTEGGVKPCKGTASSSEICGGGLRWREGGVRGEVLLGATYRNRTLMHDLEKWKQ